MAEAQVYNKITLGLARAGVEEFQHKPSAAGTDGSQTYDYVQIPLNLTVNYHAERSESLPAFRGLCCHFSAKN